MLAHLPRHALSGRAGRGHVAAIGDMAAATLLIGAQIIGPDDLSAVLGDQGLAIGSGPIGDCIGLARSCRAAACRSCPARITGSMMRQIAARSCGVAGRIIIGSPSRDACCDQQLRQGLWIRIHALTNSRGSLPGKNTASSTPIRNDEQRRGRADRLHDGKRRKDQSVAAGEPAAEIDQLVRRVDREQRAAVRGAAAS